MKHSITFNSFCRRISASRLEQGIHLHEDDKTVWTAKEVIDELSSLPDDAPVVVESADGEQESILFHFDCCEDGDGNQAMFVVVDMQQKEDEDDV